MRILKFKYTSLKVGFSQTAQGFGLENSVVDSLELIDNAPTFYVVYNGVL